MEVILIFYEANLFVGDLIAILVGECLYIYFSKRVYFLVIATFFLLTFTNSYFLIRNLC